MAAINRSETVPFSAREMFELVNDVASYPVFLDWCEAAHATPLEDNRLRARISVAKGKFRYAFTTDNTIVPARRIEMRLVKGPFKRLSGVWLFEDAGRGCHVSLSLEFEFASRIAGAALSRLFTPIGNSLVDSFRRRAVDVYGVR